MTRWQWIMWPWGYAAVAMVGMTVLMAVAPYHRGDAHFWATVCGGLTLVFAAKSAGRWHNPGDRHLWAALKRDLDGPQWRAEVYQMAHAGWQVNWTVFSAARDWVLFAREEGDGAVVLAFPVPGGTFAATYPVWRALLKTEYEWFQRQEIVGRPYWKVFRTRIAPGLSPQEIAAVDPIPNLLKQEQTLANYPDV